MNVFFCEKISTPLRVASLERRRGKLRYKYDSIGREKRFRILRRHLLSSIQFIFLQLIRLDRSVENQQIEVDSHVQLTADPQKKSQRQQQRLLGLQFPELSLLELPVRRQPPDLVLASECRHRLVPSLLQPAQSPASRALWPAKSSTWPCAPAWPPH